MSKINSENIANWDRRKIKWNEPIYFKPDHENPNDIWCPNCKEYKDYCYNRPTGIYTKLYVCPKCNNEVTIS